MNSEKIKKFISDAKIYWSHPMPGRYMPFKEITAYSVGGIGMYFLIYCIQQLTLSTTNLIIGNAIGIEPNFMYLLYAVSIIISFPATAIRASIIDNARSKQGKYRPYMLTMAFPTAAIAVGMVMVPYEKIESQIIKGIIVLLFNVGIQFFYMFFYEAYENLIMVLSPDTQERADVLTIKSVVYSLAPSIATAILPFVAALVTEDGSITDMNVYRVLFPPFAVIGILCSVYIYANTQEKIVQAKTHVIRIKFWDALKAVAKNKLFWVISLAGWVGFLETTYSQMLNWCYEYHSKGDISPGAFSFLGLFVGNASLWGMLAAPFAIRKWGKKKVVIFTNILNAIFLAFLYPVVRSEPENMIWAIAVVLFMNYLMTSFGVILGPAMNADMRDYQQYITGERIDGMFSTVGLIGTVITLATSGVVPSVYESLGINEKVLTERMSEIVEVTGKTAADMSQSPYNVLYLPDIFKEVFTVIVILSVVGAVMNVIPYFFYDMTEIRQRGIIKVLKVRALFEDYGNHVLRDRDIVETIDMIEESAQFEIAQPKDLKKLKAAVKSASSKQAKKDAKKIYKGAVEYNDNIEIAKIVMDEMRKFGTPEWQFKLEEARRLAAAGLDGLTADSFDKLNELLAKAKAMPKNTKVEKEERSAAITSAKNRIYSKKIIEEKHGGHIEEFDTSVFESLFEKEDANLEQRKKLEEEISAAKKEKAAVKLASLKEKRKALKEEKKKIDAEIKKATDENSYYNKLAKPYIDAVKLVKQAENYTHYEDIKNLYDEAKVRADEAARLAEEKEEALREEQKAMKERLKAEKAQKKSEKKLERNSKKSDGKNNSKK
ncbi:MAG TPA: MFS transporter [Candidatus Eubacterium faecavium]|nr:MFS transporter [Candidatus Eubacterium faecavium]